MTTGPIRTDITSMITQKKGVYPAGAARRTLAQVLQEFVTKTGAVLDSVDVIDIDGKKIPLKQFVEQVDKSNDVSKASLLEKVCKDPKVVAEEVIPKATQYKTDLKVHSGAEPIRITLDLSKPAQAKQKTNDTVIPGQAPVNPQTAAAQGKVVSEAGKASDIGDKVSENKFAYNDAFLAKLVMEDLGYRGKV